MTNASKKPLQLPPTGKVGGGIAPKSTPAIVDPRTITKVIDTSLPESQQVRTANNVLDGLTQQGVAELRAEIGNAHAAGADRFLCAHCRKPVLMLQRLPGPDVPKDGRGAYFKHYPDKDADRCLYRTPHEEGVRARKYDGAQEGLEHETLKHQLADCLRADDRFTDVQLEHRITAPDGGYRVPDVGALFDGQMVAFDLQLATLPVADILARSAFYAGQGIRHVWVTDAVDLSRLSQQAFIDLHLTMGGRMFAIDDTSVAASLGSGRFRLQELHIVPRLVSGYAIHNIWTRELVTTDVIFMDPTQRAEDGRLRYRDTLADQAKAMFGNDPALVRQAIGRGNGLRSVGLNWDRIALPLHGSGVGTAIACGVEEVLGFLAQVQVFANVPVVERAGTLPALNQQLEQVLHHRDGLHWAPLIETVFKIVPAVRAAISASNATRFAQLLTASDPVKSLSRRNAGALSVLYPWLSFWLLARAPKHGPKLRPNSGRG